MSLIETMKIRLLKEKVKAYRRAAHDQGRFSLFDAKFATDIFSKETNYEYLNWIYEVILGWDKLCNIPYGVGISIDRLAHDSTVMIHRTRLDLDTSSAGLPNSEDLYNIMNDGLKNYGHMNAVGGGAFSSTPPSLTLTMTPLTGLTGYINFVSSYHGNDAIVIAAFPKELVDEDGTLNNNVTWDQIYELSEYPPRVKNEFMAGAILKKSNGLDEFYTRDEIINSYGQAKK